MADDIQYMTDAEIEATWGKGSAAKIREQDRLKRLATQETFVDENQSAPPRRRNRDRNQPPPPPESTEADFLPAPSNRPVGGVRGRYESPAEFRFRMNQGIPRGARGGGGGGLDEQMLLQTGMSAEDARLKANILRSQGGRVVRRDDGSLGSESATARRAPRSSTGRDYDPVAERKAMLANAKAAVDERKNLQASDAILLRKQEEAARTLGTMRGFANEKGWGEGKTVLKSAPRPEATVTLGRNNPYTLPMREEIGFMENDMKAEADFLKQKVKPKMKGGEVNPGISTMITGEDGPELQFKREDGSLFVIPADITAKITAGLEMEDSEDGEESLRAIKGGKVKPKMNGGGFGGQQQMDKAWVKEYRNTLTGMRGGTPMPGITNGMSPYAATLTAIRGGTPMPGVR